MGTKNEPGAFDCYANAEPDEPMFVLLARDEKAPSVVREWALRYWRAKTEPTRGVMTPEQFAKFNEALLCADRMEAWRVKRPEKPDGRT